jgi:apyrase
LAGASGKCFFTVFLFLVCFSLYLFSFSRGYQFSSNFDNAGTTRNRGYAIIIDAGSSGSRVHVFQYIDNGPLPIVTIGREDLSLKTKPGLSSFAEDPHKAGYSLMDLLKFASSKVPERERETARIYLMATAGLRRLDFGTQERILESCRIVLQVSGFRFRDEWASVVSGL